MACLRSLDSLKRKSRSWLMLQTRKSILYSLGTSTHHDRSSSPARMRGWAGSQEARSQGARKAERLDVPVPSHCSLLQPVADSLRNQLQSISVKDPKPIYLANVDARAVRSAQGVAKDLADNIAHGVRWHDATVVGIELGCELLLEVPPGHILTDLARENLPGIQAHAVTSGTFDRLSILRGTENSGKVLRSTCGRVSKHDSAVICGLHHFHFRCIQSNRSRRGFSSRKAAHR